MGKLTDKQKVDIINAYQIHLVPVQEMAEAVGVSRQAIYKLLRGAGVKPNGTIKVSCTCCRTEIVRHRCRIRKQGHHFCSSECYFAWLGAGGVGGKSRQGKRIARMVVSRYFPLEDEHVVHHINGNQFDNHPSNHMVFRNQGDHILHHRGFWVEPMWDGSIFPPYYFT